MAVNPSLTEVKDEVGLQIANANTRADNATENANNMLSGLMNAANLSTPSIGPITGGNVVMSVNTVATVAPDRPTTAIDEIKGRVGDPPDDDFETTPITTNFPTIDEKTIVPPVVSLPDAPTFTQEVSADKPIIGEPTNATGPTEAVPDKLTSIGDYTIPAPPSITVADFGDAIPAYTATIPTVSFNFVETEYTSALKDALDSKLLSDVQNGGTGLSEEVEDAIWERTRERDERDYDDAASKLDSRWSGRGFNLPDGVLAELQQDLVIDNRNQRTERSRDILIKQAELAQTNTHFAITSSLSLEQLELNHANQVNNRALEAEKAAVEFAISYHNLKVADYNIQLERYKAQAIEVAARLDGEKLKLEAYRTELLESQAKGELDKNLLSEYGLDLERYDKLLKLFTAEQGAVATALGIEGLKIDFYKENINDHRARVDAQSKEAELYLAQVKGELGKVQLYESELSAERTRIDTLKLQSDVEVAKLKANINLQELDLRAFLGNIEKYKAVAGVATAELSQEGAMYGHDINKFRAEVARDAAQINLAVETMIKGRALDLQNTNISLENAKANLQAIISTASLRLAASKGIADAYTGITQAAMSGFSAIASIESGGLSSENEEVT